jgi:cyclic-di-AMP phosphodiesterase PgpH
MTEKAIDELFVLYGMIRKRKNISARKGKAQKGAIIPSSWKRGLKPETRKWFILIGLSIVVSLLLFPDILVKPRDYALGDVADRDIKATRDFLVENEVLTQEKREQAVRGALSVYDFDPTGNNAITRIREAFQQGREYREEKVPLSGAKTSEETLSHPEAFEERFFEILEIEPDNALFQSLSKSGFPPRVEKAVIYLLNKVLQRGVVGNEKMLLAESGKGIILRHVHREKETKVTDLNRFYDLEKARAFLRGQGPSLDQILASSALIRTAVDLSLALIKPNVTFNKRETELRKDAARKLVKPVYFKVKKGEMLVREGEIIKPEHLLKLNEEYKSSGWKATIGRTPAMALLVAFLLSTTYIMGLMSDGTSRGDVKDTLFCALTVLVIFLVAIASQLVSEEIARGFSFLVPRALFFVVPVATGAMLISIFPGFRVAVTFSLILGVLTSLVVHGGVDFFLYYFVGSLIAAHGVRNCRDRGTLIKAGLNVALANVALAIAVEALHGALYGVELGIACLSAFLGGILVGVIATGILPLVEMAFGFTTDIKLLELASLDQPLLKELMVRAPGTYHHSVIVSNLAEASAEAINANPLLTKVAAYYHDIGKMKKPLYFIENQGHRENKHEKLAPSMSSLILISHVKDGIELAREHRLGREIIDIIQQHHGTSLIQYFYQKAREQAEKKGTKIIQVKEEDFRYPGPKPQTKEAGLIMLADVVEAASKTLVDPTVARVQGLVQKMVNRVFSDGQMDECELTLKDLNEIAKSFNKTLSGMFHHRVDYPEPVGKDAQAKKHGNGNSNRLSNGDARDTTAEDRESTGENLRRLGLS